MAAEVRYGGGPGVAATTDVKLGVMRGDAVLWVRVGKSDQLRAVVLTNQELIRLAHNALDILNRRLG